MQSLPDRRAREWNFSIVGNVGAEAMLSARGQLDQHIVYAFSLSAVLSFITTIMTSRKFHCMQATCWSTDVNDFAGALALAASTVNVVATGASAPYNQKIKVR